MDLNSIGDSSIAMNPKVLIETKWLLHGERFYSPLSNIYLFLAYVDSSSTTNDYDAAERVRLARRRHLGVCSDLGEYFSQALGLHFS